MGLIDGSLQAAASAANGVLGYLGTRQTNRTNKRIADAQNALNYQLFQEQNAYNNSQWNRENWYNLPVNQRKRLEEAGYNPASLLDAPQLGAATSAPGSVTPAPAVGYQFQSPLQSFGSSFAQMADAMKSISEARRNDKETQNFDWKLTEEIDLWKKQGLLSEAQADEIRQKISLNDATWDDLMNTVHANAYLTDRNAHIAELQHSILQEYGHVSAEANLDKLCAEAYDLIQDGKYKDAARALMPADLSLRQAMVAIEGYRSRTERMVGSATARELSARAAGEEIANNLNSIFGENERWIELGRKISEGKIKDSEAFLAELDKYLYGKDNFAGKLAKGSRWLGEVITNVLPFFKRIKF